MNFYQHLKFPSLYNIQVLQTDKLPTEKYSLLYTGDKKCGTVSKSGFKRYVNSSTEVLFRLRTLSLCLKEMIYQVQLQYSSDSVDTPC